MHYVSIYRQLNRLIDWWVMVVLCQWVDWLIDRVTCWTELHSIDHHCSRFIDWVFNFLKKSINQSRHQYSVVHCAYRCRQRPHSRQRSNWSSGQQPGFCKQKLSQTFFMSSVRWIKRFFQRQSQSPYPSILNCQYPCWNMKKRQNEI